VVGEGGPIQVGAGSLSVAQTGEVQVDGVTAGRIVPRTVPDATKLLRLGGSLFAVPQGQPLSASQYATIHQGYLETSNVDIVGEMVDMIVSYRNYEANARALQTQDSSLDNLMKNVANRG